MYIETVPNRNSTPAMLLREAWRVGKKVRKRTVANLADWPQTRIENMRRVLRDEPLISQRDHLKTERTHPHGHVEAILGTIRKLGLDAIIASKPCRERDLFWR